RFFVLPSYVEPFGIVCLEAMRAGKAVIATGTGGPPEFIRHGENGLLVEPKDSRSLAAAMTVLLADEAVNERLGQQGRRDVADFSWKAIAWQYARLYDSVTGKPRRTVAGARSGAAVAPELTKVGSGKSQ
ncbi:MAG: glycosyltransferase, partial [Terriglobales bacterium]